MECWIVAVAVEASKVHRKRAMWNSILDRELLIFPPLKPASSSRSVSKAWWFVTSAAVRVSVRWTSTPPDFFSGWETWAQPRPWLFWQLRRGAIVQQSGFTMLIPISLEASRLLLSGTFLEMKSVGLLPHPASLAGMEEEVMPGLDHVRVLNCKSDHHMWQAEMQWPRTVEAYQRHRPRGVWQVSVHYCLLSSTPWGNQRWTTTRLWSRLDGGLLDRQSSLITSSRKRS